LTAVERQQLLVEWNETARVFRSEEPGARKSETDGWSLHELFEAQAARTPDAVAIVFDQRPTTTADEGRKTKDEGATRNHPEGTRHATRNTHYALRNTQHLTYRELNRRANQLAHTLHR